MQMHACMHAKPPGDAHCIFPAANHVALDLEAQRQGWEVREHGSGCHLKLKLLTIHECCDLALELHLRRTNSKAERDGNRRANNIGTLGEGHANLHGGAHEQVCDHAYSCMKPYRAGDRELSAAREWKCTIYLHRKMHVCTHASEHVHTYDHMHAQTRARKNVRGNMCSQTHAQTHARACTHMRTHLDHKRGEHLLHWCKRTRFAHLPLAYLFARACLCICDHACFLIV